MNAEEKIIDGLRKCADELEHAETSGEARVYARVWMMPAISDNIPDTETQEKEK